MKKYYCGPYWAPRWLKKILSVHFNASCKIHDLDYASKQFTKEQADTRFLQFMNKQAGSNIILRIKAYIYYLIVKKYGHDSWEYEE